MAIVWLWIVLLHFNLTNQTHPDFLAEDTENKPWRPIPAKRISHKDAVRARYVCGLACVLMSGYVGGVGLVGVYAVFMGLAWVYNLFGGARNGFAKNGVTGLGLCCLALGTTFVAGE